MRLHQLGTLIIFNQTKGAADNVSEMGIAYSMDRILIRQAMVAFVS